MVQLVADNADSMLVPGGYAKVLLTEMFEPAKIAVKVSAVMFEGEKRFVYVVGEGDVAERREIKTGVQIGDLQLVESGLSADERVIVTGIHKVIAGQAVIAK
jgi:multidrug efflux pump subunit AcrA (membrane-fusion protein)